MNKVRIHLIIEGRVQGVWFRDSTRQEAQKLGITGWVRNKRDGSVEAVIEGMEEQVKKLVAWCHHGPPSASVRHVVENAEPWRGEFDSFEIVFSR